MKTLKKYLYKKCEKHRGAVIALHTSLITFILSSNTIYAANTGSIDNFITYICDWMKKIGGVVGLIGGIMFCAGWLRDDADGKYRGLMVVMAGFMMIGIANAPDIFGL